MLDLRMLALNLSSFLINRVFKAERSFYNVFTSDVASTAYTATGRSDFRSISAV